MAEANVGIRTGKESGLVVLDVDPRHGGEQTLSTLLASHGSLAATLEVVTGSGGQHLYFKHPGVPVGTRAHALGTGLDLKGDGGYVVAPPSLHIEGARYHWTEQWDAVTLAPLPAWMLEHVANGNRSNGVVVSKELPNQIGPGHRNETCIASDGSVYARGLSGAGVTAALLTRVAGCGYETTRVQAS